MQTQTYCLFVFFLPVHIPIILKCPAHFNQSSTSKIEHATLNDFTIPILSSRSISGVEVECCQLSIGRKSPTKFPASKNHCMKTSIDVEEKKLENCEQTSRLRTRNPHLAIGTLRRPLLNTIHL